MTQCMEAWFLADRDALARFFGHGFRASALPGRADDVESVAKGDVPAGLADASRNSRKGVYSKGGHSFEILGALDPDRVFSDAAPHAKRLLETLERLL